MDEVDEQLLVEQARYDPQCFAMLYDRYVDQIYAFAYVKTKDEAAAADITSATFEKALRHLRLHWRGGLFRAWLYKIAYHEIIDFYRRGKPTVSLDECEGLTYIDSEVRRIEESEDLRNALNLLSKSDHDVITLRYFHDLSIEDIAMIFGWSKDNVYVRLHRALQRLKNHLQTLELEETRDASE